jgi:hypothetical protein
VAAVVAMVVGELQLAPYAPSAFFIDPEGQVRTDLVNRFAPADQVRPPGRAMHWIVISST